MLPACGPIASTQPAMTSSTAPGSTLTRPNRPRHAAAPRSTGWTPASDPFRFPTAVRTASTTYAWEDTAISGSFFCKAAESDGQVLTAGLLGGQRSARLMRADRTPCGVTDEPVHQVDID